MVIVTDLDDGRPVFGFTVTVTLHLPALVATTAAPFTRQYFAEEPVTTIFNVDPFFTVSPAKVAKDAADLDFPFFSDDDVDLTTGTYFLPGAKLSVGFGDE